MSNNEHKTSRSMKTSIIDDNAVISLNIKWLAQVCVLIGATVYGYLQVEWRIQELERNMEEANSEIQELVSKHIEDEEERYSEMEEQLKWYQKEFNLNPLSWRKKKK
jgi:prefoldin subunit 5